ncbi:MAG: PIN domain-containing protein, partial [Opitutaceae bacterium]
WTAVVRLELWNGARGDREKRALREFEEVLPELEMAAAVWDIACDLARRSRAGGLTVPVTDLMIAACARHHGVEIDSTDPHFAELEKL